MFGKLKNVLGFGNAIKIFAPMNGTTVALSDVNDLVFKDEILGRGIAMLPVLGRLVSPVNGVVSHMFDTGHAITLTSDEGVEILMHIGLDTVRLKGKHFTSLRKNGDKIKIGDVLIDFDLEKIKQEGYDSIVPIVVCNSDNFKKIDVHAGLVVTMGDEIISLTP